jgi:NAD(P)-dependent dehydrogenase (short-subunit alcohol dehydrogenase family)
LKQISEDPSNLVVGLVRNKDATEKKIAAEFGARSNIHILHGDLTNHASLKQAAADAAPLLGARGLDYLIANAGNVAQWDAYDPIGVL